MRILHGTLLAACAAAVGTLAAAPATDETQIAAFWAFQDGAAGTEAGTLVNAADAGRFPATAAKVGYYGTVPAFAADAPGRLIWADAAKSALLAERPQSLHFSPGKNEAGGRLAFDGLAAALAAAGDWTVEVFVKPENTATWRTVISFMIGEAAALNLNLPASADKSIRLAEMTETDGAVSVVRQNYRTTATTFYDDAWHHVALVHSASDAKTALYYDYAYCWKFDTSAGTPAADAAFVLGTSCFSAKEKQEAFGGFLACPRVSFRTLDIAEFLVAEQTNGLRILVK